MRRESIYFPNIFFYPLFMSLNTGVHARRIACFYFYKNQSAPAVSLPRKTEPASAGLRFGFLSRAF